MNRYPRYLSGLDAIADEPTQQADRADCGSDDSELMELCQLAADKAHDQIHSLVAPPVTLH